MHTAYSIILFGDTTKNAVVNDFTSPPDQLLDSVLNDRAEGGTNFTAAIQASQAITIDNWNTERTPVMVFLSDGQSSVQDKAVIDLCPSAIQFSLTQTSKFFQWPKFLSTPSLHNMVHIALEIQNRAPGSVPPDPLLPAAARIPSSFNTAPDTGIGESLRKPRGSLMRR
ncbi:hypothetical protein EDB85DRAFT_1866205 [Lactarius pseudohatsudake]|nr:hypothetical protein EDB85DRAFT_1866205 [Lactarius pseudohatsudake]